MVKRIKKRIPKSETDTARPAGDAPEDGAAAPGADVAPVDDGAGFRAELESLGEDDFTRTVAGGVGWVVSNRGLIIAGIGITAAVIIAIVVMQSQKTAGIAEAATAFSDASETYLEAVRPPMPGSEEPTLTDEERKARVEKAAQAFERTRQTYDGQPIAALASLGEAGTRLDLGQTDQAIERYTQALAKPGMPPMTEAIALQGQAAALENKGDLAGAIDAWKRVEGIDKSAFGLMAGMQIGRLLEASGKPAEAKAAYERVQTDHAASLDQLGNRGLKTDLERRIARLGEPS